ncbi:hypothetical protein BLNAU_3086 [Blattamonas nauphoetae]|uniref:Uncharacterized protein n=1 Tax=Blattamonas nauphoetae TaxID=2049346 RepID=A0ABQ9YEC4_9EUKA|nr:hypothetical protein BLNAU_3086 [Blattamonas nauphoetae]
MPPKHKLRKARIRNPPKLRKNSASSSTSDIHIVTSTIQDSIENDNDSSLDPRSIPSTTDVVTITANDRHFIRVSKRILQYELKRKRLNIEELMEQAHLEGDAISLPTPPTSDWRLVLQDSITTDDRKQGCISLFEQVNSGLNLTPTEVFHAVRFLEYATVHIEYREYPHNKLLETIFPEEANCQTRLTSALIKLVCHPSDKLRRVALTFFAASFRNSSDEFLIAVATAGLLPQLFEHLKPHDIPLNRTTIDFHRHFTSILDNFFRRSSWHRLACLTDSPSGISLLSNLRIYVERVLYLHDDGTNPELKGFFDELRKNMTEALLSSLDLATTRETLHQLVFNDERSIDKHRWAETFARILHRMGEGRQCSDLGVHALLLFMFRCPKTITPVFQSDGTFSLKVNGELKFSLELPSKTLGNLVITRPHNASVILDRFSFITSVLADEALVRHLKDGWYSTLFHAITLSKFPFTNEFRSHHTQLFNEMNRCLFKIRKKDESKERIRSLSQLDELYLSLLRITKEYVVHVSLHPFALDTGSKNNIILDFFTDFFEPSFENSVTKPFRVELRKDMDETALSSSSPPFILTSDLVCHLTDEEIMNVVDRIVALLESDSPISDDTILRICTFTKMKLKSVYLPELFRKAGRSTEQYFHAFNSLISLPLDHFTLCPINSLLTSRPHSLQPTLDEWDDVDLATVGVVMPFFDGSQHFSRHVAWELNQLLLKYVISVITQMSHCATRLTITQLERLIAPSTNILIEHHLVFRCSKSEEIEKRENLFLKISRLCEQHMIAQCLSRIGFFSRLVNGFLTTSTFLKAERIVYIFLHKTRSFGHERSERRKQRRTVPNFLEEGWQDVLDFIFVTKTALHGLDDESSKIKGMMHFHGANLGGYSNWDYSLRYYPFIRIHGRRYTCLT